MGRTQDRVEIILSCIVPSKHNVEEKTIIFEPRMSHGLMPCPAQQCRDLILSLSQFHFASPQFPHLTGIPKPFLLYLKGISS